MRGAHLRIREANLRAKKEVITMPPIIAIIGRPNTGKSTLFNRLAGRRISIIDDTPGVTRDRIYASCDWNGRDLTLIDTAGIEDNTPASVGGAVSGAPAERTIQQEMRRQAEIAINVADIIVFVCDVQVGVTADDEAIATLLRKSKKPIILAVNKCDSIGDRPAQFYEFYNLALGEPIAISAIHGKGTGDLLDEVIKQITTNNEQRTTADEFAEANSEIKVAVVGKPNAGKSSLVNKILGEERMIVSSVAGTTRDSVDCEIERDGNKYVFVDTAGMRKRAKVEEGIEKFSVMRALDSIDRADVTLLLIDGVEGVSEQDSKIIGYAHDNCKPIVIAVNKWDLVMEATRSPASVGGAVSGAPAAQSQSMVGQNLAKKFKSAIAKEFPFAFYAPIIFISAKTGQRLGEIFEKIHFVHEQSAMRVPTSALNEVIAEAIMRAQPPAFKGKRLKVYYATQAGVKPPTFTLFVNDKNLMHFSYQRYLENQIRDNFNFEGTIIKINLKGKGE